MTILERVLQAEHVARDYRVGGSWLWAMRHLLDLGLDGITESRERGVVCHYNGVRFEL